MKLVKEDATIDGVAEPGDQFQVEVQKDIAGGFKLYVSVNGKTILRVGRIVNIEYARFPKAGAMPEPDKMHETHTGG
jgi:hypothetical protein